MCVDVTMNTIGRLCGCGRVHFDYRQPEHGEMSFSHGEVFHITETLYQGVVGSWQAARLSRSDPDKEVEKGIIPNNKR